LVLLSDSIGGGGGGGTPTPCVETNFAGYFEGDVVYTGTLYSVSDSKFKTQIENLPFFPCNIDKLVINIMKAFNWIFIH